MEHLPVPLDTLVEDLHRQASLLGQERGHPCRATNHRAGGGIGR